jgi:hypothetical protein
MHAHCYKQAVIDTKKHAGAFAQNNNVFHGRAVGDVLKENAAAWAHVLSYVAMQVENRAQMMSFGEMMHANQKDLNHDCIERALLELANGGVRDVSPQLDLRSYEQFAKRDFAFDYEAAYPILAKSLPVANDAHDYGSYFGV